MSLSGDDELMGGPSRSPRWLRPVMWAVVAVVAGAVVVSVVSRRHVPTSVPPSPLPVTSPPVTAPVLTQPAAIDVVVTGQLRWVLRGRTLSVTPGGAAAARQVRLPATFAASRGDARLVADAEACWVVLENGRTTAVAEVTGRPLHVVREISWPTSADGAAAYGHHLYLATGRGVADLAPGAAEPQLVPGLAGAVGPVVADPWRHRMIAIDLGYPTSLWTFGPHRAPVEAAAPIPVEEAGLAVAGGAIWLLGRSATGPVLARLDPGTLRPRLRVPLPAQLGSKPILLPAAGGALWLAGRGVAGGVVCADARSGAVGQSWMISGVSAVAVQQHTALLATRAGIRRVALTRCGG